LRPKVLKVVVFIPSPLRILNILSCLNC
jgi:hypothetical protein